MPVYQRFLPFLAGLALIVLNTLIGAVITNFSLLLVATGLLFLAAGWILGRYIPFQQKGARLFVILPALFVYLNTAKGESWFYALISMCFALALSAGLFLGLAPSPPKAPRAKPLLAYILLLGVTAAIALPFLQKKLDAAMLHNEDTAVAPFALQLADGTDLSSDRLIGKVVLLDFWGTWCSPCLRQFPHLQTLYQRYQDHPRFAFYAVNTAEGGDDLAKVRRFIAANAYTFAFAFNNTDLRATSTSPAYP